MRTKNYCWNSLFKTCYSIYQEWFLAGRLGLAVSRFQKTKLEIFEKIVKENNESKHLFADLLTHSSAYLLTYDEVSTMQAFRAETATQAQFRSIEDLQSCGINVSDINKLKEYGIATVGTVLQLSSRHLLGKYIHPTTYKPITNNSCRNKRIIRSKIRKN